MGSATERQPVGSKAFSRRSFLSATGHLGLAAALAGLPDALLRHGVLDAATTADPNLARDALDGLVAFVAPGNDAHSVAQGVSTRAPGGIAAGVTEVMIETLDRALPAPVIAASTGTTVPASGAVALLLDHYAVQVNPVVSRGGFSSAFARLSFSEKAEAFRRLESDPKWEDSQMRNLGALLPAFPAFLTFTEAGAFDGGKLTGTPVGWSLTGYAGPSDGWDEYKGFYGGRRKARTARRHVRRRNRRPRKRRGGGRRA